MSGDGGHLLCLELGPALVEEQSTAECLGFDLDKTQDPRASNQACTGSMPSAATDRQLRLLYSRKFATPTRVMGVLASMIFSSARQHPLLQLAAFSASEMFWAVTTDFLWMIPTTLMNPCQMVR